MARLHKPHTSLYIHPLNISFGTADADLADTVFSIAVPGKNMRVYDFGIAVKTAQVGGTGYLVGLQKLGTTTFVTEQAVMTSAAAGAQVTAIGNGTTLEEGDRLEINVDVTGTVTTALAGSLWIRFQL